MLTTVSVVIAVVAGALLLAAAVDRSVPDRETGPGFGPGPVAAGSAYTQAWEAAVDGLAPGIDPKSPNPCRAGEHACLEAVIEEMEARLAHEPCTHNAPFAFTYLEMTRGVQRRAADPGFFDDPRIVIQIDALFARLYFDAFDNWAAGRNDHVPGAWQLAFEAADRRATSAAADLMLGMNAHISRDLAYAAAMMLEGVPGFTDDPSDYVRVIEVIDEVRAPMLEGAANRFDPAIASLDRPLPPEAGLTPVDLIGMWRNEAFELARRLTDAPTPTARDTVAAEIERLATAAATMVLNTDGVLDDGLPPDERLEYCRRSR